jgi:hypothetical protein
MRGDDRALKLASSVCFTFTIKKLERDEQLQMEIHIVMYLVHMELWDCVNGINTNTKRERFSKSIIHYQCLV